MRPLRLDLHGFTVFREPTTVDFSDADFFALVGPTGAGKSTILDAIVFALYGTVPRWADRRGGIENCLAPSAGQAKVRLVFEVKGNRFVASRVIRRDGKGRVSTAHAGLEQLPPGFDLAGFDQAPADRADPLGTVLAGTAAEMEQAVLDTIGLPYEQFTTCVVLPQGEFARFLHAKPKDRQDILVNLLGLQVYEKIGTRAGIRQRDAEAHAAAARSLLADLSGCDDAALAAADEALQAARALAAQVEAQLPALREASEAGERARGELARVEAELAALATVRPPKALAELHAELCAARDAAAAAQAQVQAAEDREAKARSELTAAGDRAVLTRLLDAYAQRTSLAARVAELAGVLQAATAEQEKAAARLAKAHGAVEKSAEAVRAAQAGVEAAQTADRAASLRVHLVAGQPCPVCEQPVAAVPATGAPLLRAAREKFEKAEAAARKAAEAERAEDKALRDAERRAAVAAAQHQESHGRLVQLESTLEGAPTASEVERALTTLAEREREVAGLGQAVTAARQAARAAAARLSSAEERERAAWRDYDRARDAVATLAPPSADRDQLVDSWRALAGWAAERTDARTGARETILADAEAALTALAEVTGRLDALVGGHGGTRDAATYQQAAAVAVERASAARERVLERREQAEKLRDQLAGHERDAQVAKSLALHLRADRFERWLLTEALDSLVDGASRILRDLSSGRYELTHTKGEFWVVDHADASLPRAVRTLSGGETFQASLALALALSEQLAGLASTSANLESIMLDEGFGTLDPDTMETVAATLENLVARGDRMVGVVTHVAALADRIPVRFEVRRLAHGSAGIVRMP